MAVFNYWDEHVYARFIASKCMVCLVVKVSQLTRTSPTDIKLSHL